MSEAFQWVGKNRRTAKTGDGTIYANKFQITPYQRRGFKRCID